MSESTVIDKTGTAVEKINLHTKLNELAQENFMLKLDLRDSEKDCEILKAKVLALQSKLDEIDKQEPIAWLAQCKTDAKLLEIAWPRERATNKHCWSDAFPVFTRVGKS